MQRRTFTKQFPGISSMQKIISDGISLPLNHQNPVRIFFFCRFDPDTVQIRVQIAVHYRHGSRTGYESRSTQIQGVRNRTDAVRPTI